MKKTHQIQKPCLKLASHDELLKFDPLNAERLVVGLWKGSFNEDLKMVIKIMIENKEIVIAFSELGEIFESALSGKFELNYNLIDKFHDYLAFI